MACETIVIGLNWVGDNVLALPTYKALAHRFRSEGGLAVAAPSNVTALLEATGLFKKVVPWTRSTRERISVLRAGGYRRAVILPNSFKAALVTFAAGIDERWGYPTDMRGLFLNRAVAKPATRGHQLDDYTALLAALNAPRVVRASLECTPCYQRDCPLRTHQCMNDISVDQVFSAAVSLFEPAEIEAERVL